MLYLQFFLGLGYVSQSLYLDKTLKANRAIMERFLSEEILVNQVLTSDLGWLTYFY
jgi:hypothetical protein